MAEKRPTIHPFFTAKKKKSTKSTEDAESTADLPTSINNANDINSKKVSNEDASLVVVDDESEEDAASSFVDDQPEKLLSSCDLVCFESPTVYVPTIESELQSMLTKDKRSCQSSWFNTYSWFTFCKVRYYKKKTLLSTNNL
jgi:hypothetical protein